MVRNTSIDALKGLLIICVIIGHALYGSLNDNILRYVIYSFHMPVFLFMSGYLFNYNKISTLTIRQLFQKYWNRMLLPWIIALLVYSVVLTATNFTPLALIKRMAHPYYHLWYVPTLFTFIILTWLSSHIKNKSIAIVILISLGLLMDSLYVQSSAIRLNYLIFFAVGVMARISGMSVKNLRLGGGILFLFLLVVTILSTFNVTMDFYIRNLRIPFMMCLCLLSVLPIVLLDKFQCLILSYIGEHSLEIYLWHVLPIIILKHFIDDAQELYLYYLLITVFLIMMLVYSWFKTIKLTIKK